MKVRERGVLPTSDVYFHTASETARRMYFYVRCVGQYQCDGNYCVRRQSYDSFLILHVLAGSGYCELDGRRVPLQQGSFALIDCYRPHCYGTDEGWEILWIHFDGVLAREYHQAIVGAKKQVIAPPNPYNAMRGLSKIYRMYHHEKRAVEPLISKNITSVLTEFLIFDGTAEKRAEHSGNIEELLNFISENIDQPLTLEQLAQKVYLSPFYFSRVFKKETGYTVRDYLIHTRINAAKFYLKTTQLSLKEISYRLGYSSDSTFCTTFKRVTGTTPLDYRSHSV
ncbi:MAG: AraC family transcriptional regulator [Clostridiales bacterium]|nr:AraC family transcriptional regulator [Clostridiales bacterium]